VLIVAALIGLALGLVTGGPAGPLLTLVASVLAFAMSRGPRTRRQLELQAPMAIGLLSSGLRAGYSVPQSIALVARESPAPTAEEFRQASREIEVGVSLPDALQRLAERTGLAEYQLVAIIVGVQHEVGGDLPHALDDVETTVRERQELREQIAALTAQQRLSSIVLSALPFAIFGFMLAADRQYAEPMLTTLVGRVLLTITVALVGANWFIMQSLGKLE
jgi:tight adherence protein B